MFSKGENLVTQSRKEKFRKDIINPLNVSYLEFISFIIGIDFKNKESKL